MLNLGLVASIFVIVLFSGLFIVFRQFRRVKKVRSRAPDYSILGIAARRGIRPLGKDKFEQRVLAKGRETAWEVSQLSEVPQSEQDRGHSGKSSDPGTGNGYPADKLSRDHLSLIGQPLDIGDKDLKTIYREYLTARDNDPYDMEPEFKLGVAYLRFGQYEKAMKQFRKVIERKPGYPGVHYFLGESLRCNGEYFQAMESFKKSLEKDMPASH
ncbi:MAG: tetratricopeptide repeat protein [Gemmatimonadota bacterium]|nr:tetratricopeptide repeat protein [Gemmatimonadota bacterium]